MNSAAEAFTLRQSDFPDYTAEEFAIIQEKIRVVIEKYKTHINLLPTYQRITVWQEFLAYVNSASFLRVYRFEHNQKQSLKFLALLMCGNIKQYLDKHIKELIEASQLN